MLLNPTYDELLEKIYNHMKEKKLKKMVIPKLETTSTRVKTNWSNVTNIMKILKRDTNKFIKYLSKELSAEVTWKSAIRSEGIIIFMKACKKNNLESLLEKFINKYVICKNCKTYRTKIKKAKNLKLHNLKCYDCKTEYTV